MRVSPGLAVIGVLLTGACASGAEPSAAPTSEPAVTSAPTSTPPTPAAAVTHLGPDGYGALKMGMTKAEAIATGLTQLVTPGEGLCGGPGDGFLAGSPPRSGSGHDVNGWLVFSVTTGRLVALYAYPGITTAERIGIGSSYADVRAAYPDWEPIGAGTDGRGKADIAGNDAGYYRIVVLNGKVAEVSLDQQQDCYE